jgi:DNA repair photolyase
MEAVRKLNQAGIAAGVICAPVLPGITDAACDLEALVKATAEASGKYIFANPLFLKPCSAAVFLPFLEREFPRLADSYRQRFQNSAFLPKTYHKRIVELLAKLRRKYGIVNAYERYAERSHPALDNQQLSLF